MNRTHHLTPQGILALAAMAFLSLGAASMPVQAGDDHAERASPLSEEELYANSDSISPTLQHYYAERALKSGKRRLRFDVVELGTKFAFDEAPVDANEHPLYGNPFITQGVIYPAGTIQVDADGNANGVVVETDADGNVVARPEFPELVLGTWICRGTVFADDGFNIASGPTVYSNQLFDFHAISGEYGRISFETSGLELIDIGEAIRRPVVGGTGPFRLARGQMQQTFIGVNPSQGFALRFETSLR